MTVENTYYKICNECRLEKIMTAFSVNQYGKNNRILRRPVCIDCYGKKKKISTTCTCLSSGLPQYLLRKMWRC